ncbi:MAG: hypothetical protein ACI30H_09385 [Paludibacteraceae bacterium]
MKQMKFFAAACCMAAVFAACEKNDPNNGTNNIQAGATGIENGHEWVDLGLPSGTKWATCNVGATKPEEYGNYYAWGETEPKTTYNGSTYKWATATYNAEYDQWDFKLTKYNTNPNVGIVDNKTVLDPEDDAARANWGSKWRMPTDEEWTELCENCAWKWTDDYNGTGIAGDVVTGFNGNFIFLPAAGYRGRDDLDAAFYYGIYWSSSLHASSGPEDPIGAWSVDFGSDYVERDYNYRYDGHSVRAVLGE